MALHAPFAFVMGCACCAIEDEPAVVASRPDATKDESKGEKTESGLWKWLQLKYYHYTLWTGLYMMDKSEARVINVMALFFVVMFLRWLSGVIAYAYAV